MKTTQVLTTRWRWYWHKAILPRTTAIIPSLLSTIGGEEGLLASAKLNNAPNCTNTIHISSWDKAPLLHRSALKTSRQNTIQPTNGTNFHPNLVWLDLGTQVIRAIMKLDRKRMNQINERPAHRVCMQWTDCAQQRLRSARSTQQDGSQQEHDCTHSSWKDCT